MYTENKIKDIYSQKLIKKLNNIDPNKKTFNFEIIEKAIFWIKKYHAKQLRKTGEPFFSHPIEVACMVLDYSIKTNVIVASLLHDIVEDTEVTVGMLVDNFSFRIAELVYKLTRNRKEKKLSVIEILNKAYQENENEVLLIKLMDRLHNLQTLHVMDPQKQKKIMKESLQEFLITCAYIENIEIEKRFQKVFIDFFKKNNKENKNDEIITNFLKNVEITYF